MPERKLVPLTGGYYELFLDEERICFACERFCFYGDGVACRGCRTIVHYRCCDEHIVCVSCTEGD